MASDPRTADAMVLGVAAAIGVLLIVATMATVVVWAFWGVS